MEFHNSSGVRSPFSPRQRQLNAARSINTFKKTPVKYLPLQNDEKGEVIYKTPHLTMETFGAPLPVTVTEALTFACVGGVSVRLWECGWGCAVVGRRVLAWALRGAGPARELALPQTDLAHKADLVVIYYQGEAQMPSCVGVSPEGTVRYWPSLAAAGAYAEATCELAGQECAALTAGLLLATTSASLVRLLPQEIDGRPTVTCKPLRPPSGFLGGLGRRVSLLFFQPAQPSETRLVGVVELEDAEGEPVTALVVAGPALQLWSRQGPHHHDLRRLLPHHHPELGGVELGCADVRVGGRTSLLLLLAAVAPDHLIRYVIAEIDVSCVSEPRVSLPGAGTVRPPRPPAAPPAPRLAPPPAAAIYTALGLSAQASPSEKPEFVDVSADGDRILGAEMCNGMTLVFTAKHGVCRILSHALNRPAGETPLEAPSARDVYDGNLSLYHIDPHEVSQVTTDAAGKLKTAFLFHVRRERAACRRLLDELFPAGADAALGRTVLDIAREMLDDMPQGDPRWRESPSPLPTCVSLGRSSALHIEAQLRDKRRALQLLVEFLRASGLWARAGERTQRAVVRLAERLAAAGALRSLQRAPGLAECVSAAVRAAAEAGEAGEQAAGGLGADDVCYRRVTRVLRVVARVALWPAPHRALHVVASVLAEMKSCRSEWESALGVREAGGAGEEDEERAALSEALLRMLRDKLRPALSRAGEHAAAAWEAAGSVATLLLPDLSPAQARQLIQLFLSEGQRERGLALAEQARDLRLLAMLCVGDDHDRLLRYIATYSDQGMLSLVLEALVASPARAGLAALLRRLAERHAAALAGWLRGPCDQEERAVRLQLLALVSLEQRAPAAAAAALADLADLETEDVERMRTAASLARLCGAAAEGGAGAGVAGRTRARLSLGAHVAALPAGLRARLRGFAHAEDIVQLYVDGADGECALSEYDYMKALELAALLPDAERRDDLRLRVWCASIRQDAWPAADTDADAGADTDHTFFRLLMLARELEVEAEMVPPLEDVVTAPELAELSDRAHYLIRAGYPHAV